MKVVKKAPLGAFLLSVCSALPSRFHAHEALCIKISDNLPPAALPGATRRVAEGQGEKPTPPPCRKVYWMLDCVKLAAVACQLMPELSKRYSFGETKCHLTRSHRSAGEASEAGLSLPRGLFFGRGKPGSQTFGGRNRN